MSSLEFTAVLVRALAWPLFCLVALLLLRRPLLNALPSVERLRFKDMELQFARTMAEAREEVETTATAVRPAPRPDATELQYFKTLAEASPRAAILEAWLVFEAAAMNALEKSDSTGEGRPAAIPVLISRLRRASLLTDKEANAVARLRGIRNDVLHAPSVRLATADVIDYVTVMHELKRALEEKYGWLTSAKPPSF